MRFASMLLRRPSGPRPVSGPPSVLPADFLAALRDPSEGPRCVVLRVARDASGEPCAFEWGVMDGGHLMYLAGPAVAKVEDVAGALAGGVPIDALFPTASGFARGGAFRWRDGGVVFEACEGSGWTLAMMAGLARR